MHTSSKKEKLTCAQLRPSPQPRFSRSAGNIPSRSRFINFCMSPFGAWKPSPNITTYTYTFKQNSELKMHVILECLSQHAADESYCFRFKVTIKRKTCNSATYVFRNWAEIFLFNVRKSIETGIKVASWVNIMPF